MSPERAIPLREFQDANWEAFARFEHGFDRAFASYSRRLPPRFYSSLRRGVIGAFGESIEQLAQAGLIPHFRVKVVLDTNIVVQDSLAVASGKASTTARILSSPFVQVFAPPQIHEECSRILRLRAKKKKLPVDVALRHADSLLRAVHLVNPADEPYIRRAREAIGSHAPEDVSFLAVAMELDANAVVSRDQYAFDRQSVTQRWELHRLVDTVVTFESGALSVVVLGAGLTGLVRALQTVVVALVGAVLEALRVVLGVLTELASGVIKALSTVPAWGWLAVGAALVGVAIYASRHPEVGQRLGEGISAIAGAVANLGQALIRVGTTVLQALHEVLVWLWNLLLPVTASTVVICGVLLRRIQALVAEASRLQRSVPST